MASDTWLFSHAAHGTVRFSWVTSSCSTSLRRPAIASIRRTISATASLRCASVGARMSMVNDTCPGMTLVAPGMAWMYPMVPTNPQTFRFQHRPLLDMEFDIGKQFAAGPCRCSDMIGIETELDERIAHRNSGTIPYAKHALVERACHRAAAQQRGGEPDPLLIGEAGDFDRERQSPAPVMQIAHAGNRRDQSKRTVPFSGIAHRVVVLAQHQARQSRSLAFVTAADVSDRVEMRLHSRLAHPCQDQVGCGAMLLAQEHACQMLVRFRNRSKPIDPADDLIAKGRVKGRVLQPGDCRIHLAHVFPMTKATPRVLFGRSIQVRCQRAGESRTV